MKTVLPSLALLVAWTTAGCIVHRGAAASTGGTTPAVETSAGATGTASGRGPANLPVPPGGHVPRPSGAPENLTVLDWAGFKAAVSYTFDDTNSSQIQHYAELQSLGVRMTFYLITGKAAELADPVWARAVKDGHELGNHSRRHVRPGTGADLDAADSDLRGRFGITVYTMASPFGDDSYPPLATTRYLINRGVVNGQMTPADGTDPFNIHCYVPPTRAPAATFNAEIDAVRNGGGWTTVLVHGFTGGSDGAYQPVDIGAFTASVNHAKSFRDIWIDSVVNVGAYWRAQKVFAEITPTTSGNSKTWTWTLPPHSPSGRVLRVKVDGGTLTQPGGRTLSWDDHGYYDVALDAGSLTLSP
jgi:peptidoglycan/xylan/chitin deacetylase (PgdA/CDA1 family)